MFRSFFEIRRSLGLIPRKLKMWVEANPDFPSSSGTGGAKGRAAQVIIVFISAGSGIV